MGAPFQTLLRSRFLAASMGVLLAGSSSAQTLVLGDDFESGVLLKSGAPPGVWTELGSNEASNTIMISAAAAHRGAAGMRLTDVTPGPGSGMITWLGGDVPQRAGSIHLRTWILLAGMTPTQLNSIMIHGNGMGSTLSGLRLDAAASPGLGGTDRAGGYSFVNAPAGGFALGTWHLVEVAALGVGTATGRRQLWLDGTLLLAQDNIDWSGLSSTSVLIGQGWGDHSWTGQISFDDIRITDGPPATTLSSRVRSGAAVAGSCTPMTAELLAAAGSPSAAPVPPHCRSCSSLPPGSGAAFDARDLSVSSATTSGGLK